MGIRHEEKPDKKVYKRRPRKRKGKPGGGSEEAFTEKEMIDALEKFHGVKAEAARYLGCSWQTVHRYCETHPEVSRACDEGREYCVDLAEGGIMELLQNGDWAAIEYTLSSRLGRKRGWGRPSVLDVPGGEGEYLPVSDVSINIHYGTADVTKRKGEAGSK